MAIQTRISNKAYERLALAEQDVKWELWDGVLREKPPMSFEYNWTALKLGHFLLLQLDWSEYGVRVDTAKVSRPSATYFIPDVFVFPMAYAALLRNRLDVLEVYTAPLPLIVEVWSRSTGDYDVKEKLEVYKQRGDLEIWFIHPYERTLTAWVRLPDGRYTETLYREGIVRPIALPGVKIDLALLFNS
jgi:Uma2 family endonuclease